MAFKLKKKRKSKGMRGTTSHGHGERKKWKGSGHRGGIGMAGTGKRADHKKTLINKLYKNKYFGKKGITSRRNEKKKNKVINLRDIEKNIDFLLKKYGNEDKTELNFRDYKILGEGELKLKLIIKAREFSESAKNKIKKSGGEAVLIKKEDKEKEINKQDK